VAVIGQCAAHGGPKWITQDAAYYAGEKDKHGKSWHPTSGMHLVRGETLAYNYVQIIADAVFTVETDLKTITAVEALKSKHTTLVIYCFFFVFLWVCFILISKFAPEK